MMIHELLAVLFQVTLRATVVLTIAVFASWSLRGRSARLRRQLWGATIVALLVLPFISVGLPRVPVPVLPGSGAPVPRPPELQPPFPHWPGPPRTAPPGFAQTAKSMPSAAPAQTSVLHGISAVSVADLAGLALVSLYGSGVCVWLIRLVRGRIAAHRLLKHAVAPGDAWPVPPGICLRASRSTTLPITVGALHPVVLVPADSRDWCPDWRQAAVAHEVAHVRAADPLLQLLAELCSTLYWFHPLVHLAVRQLHAERELVADDAVLATGMSGVDYAAMLYELACLPGCAPSRGALVPLLTPAGLRARVEGVLDDRRMRQASRAARAALVAAVGVLFVPLALAVPSPRSHSLKTPLGRGTLVGVVVDDATGKPVAGADVRFLFEGWPGASVAVTSEGDGRFRYPWDERLPASLGVYVRNGSRAARKTILSVPFGTELPVTMALREAAVLSGTVRGTDGLPVAGATVSFWQHERESFGPGRELTVQSDGSGRWRLPGILYGEYRLLFTAPWGVKTTELVVVRSTDVDEIDVQIPRQWPITGHLQDQHGAPLRGVRFESGYRQVFLMGLPTVGRFDHHERHVDWEESAEDGSFRLMPVGHTIGVKGTARDGRVYFGRFEDVGARLGRGNITAGVVGPQSSPPIVTLLPSVGLDGIVRRPGGEPVANAMVQVAHHHAAESARTDGAGRFTLKHVPPTVVTVLATEWDPSSVSFRSRAETVIDAGAVARTPGVEITLREFARPGRE